MKQQSKLLLTLLHGVGVGVGTIAALSGSMLSTDAQAGIVNTRHNLGATGTNVTGQNRVSDTGEICVFCHTPHASNSVTNAPPLWNKNLPGTTYTTYATGSNSSSLDATNNNGSIVTGSISLACLSCHDGTQAVDNIINAPGAGGVTAGGAATGLTYAWTGTGVNSAGQIINAATNLGSDLRNDHPIGIAYCGGTTAGYTDNSTAGCFDGDFKPLRLASGTNGSLTAQWYVDTVGSTTGVRDKSDMMLYTRAFGGTIANKPSVECGSCHDPHVETKATNQVAFLRVSQTGSGLCLSCHNK